MPRKPVAGFTAYFLCNQEVYTAMLLPEVVIPEIYPSIQAFKG
jgi:hypothetical protein